MSELHDALKYLGPTPWSTVPTSDQPLDDYLADLFSHAQTVIESVPLPPPDDAPQPAKAQAHGRATKASEVTLSSERSAPPPAGHEKNQKEWGKPMKIKTAENPLGLSVYKMSAKDSKGAWFARRSVHEGIGFSKFKNSLQMEFEKSLAEEGPPGTGNVRGIGGEERVEQAKTDRGTVEVYRLSAQFPGPTAARDFVTMLVTSENALQTTSKGKADSAPRHYMIISKPCDHPKTQPRSGFVRGFYESIEFIREVPRKLKSSQSAINADEKAHGHHHEAGRKRASTVDTPSAGASAHPDPSDPEDNPVEWMMITRSDPGGGIPRFLVERGTPSSICADAVKFVDWACQNEDEPPTKSGTSRPTAGRRESHQSWRSRSLVGVEEHAETQGSVPAGTDSARGPELEPVAEQPQAVESQTASEQQPQAQSQGIFGAAAATLSSFTPQVILDRLPGATAESDVAATPAAPSVEHHDRTLAPAAPIQPSGDRAETRSIRSATSFASAEDHWSSEAEEPDTGSSLNSPAPAGSKEDLVYEAELRRLDTRKEALHKKFADTQSKYEAARAKEKDDIQGESTKAKEKHEREMQKHEEKYRKELAKIERKREKEQKKVEAKMKKHADKDVQSKLMRERDEARQERDLIKKEAESLRGIVADLQKENTALVMKLGKAGITPRGDADSVRSRGSSLSRKD